MHNTIARIAFYDVIIKRTRVRFLVLPVLPCALFNTISSFTSTSKTTSIAETYEIGSGFGLGSDTRLDFLKKDEIAMKKMHQRSKKFKLYHASKWLCQYINQKYNFCYFESTGTYFFEDLGRDVSDKSLPVNAFSSKIACCAVVGKPSSTQPTPLGSFRMASTKISTKVSSETASPLLKKL